MFHSFLSRPQLRRMTAAGRYCKAESSRGSRPQRAAAAIGHGIGPFAGHGAQRGPAPESMRPALGAQHNLDPLGRRGWGRRDRRRRGGPRRTDVLGAASGFMARFPAILWFATSSHGSLLDFGRAPWSRRAQAMSTGVLRLFEPARGCRRCSGRASKSEIISDLLAGFLEEGALTALCITQGTAVRLPVYRLRRRGHRAAGRQDTGCAGAARRSRGQWQARHGLGARSLSAAVALGIRKR